MLTGAFSSLCCHNKLEADAESFEYIEFDDDRGDSHDGDDDKNE